MGIFSAITGNASAMSVEQATEEYGYILGGNETFGASYKLVRDVILFTNRRLILIDSQGMSGKKVEIRSIPYKNITQFSIETAGRLDFDAELKILVSGQSEAIVKKFNKNVNIYEVQAILAEAIVNYSK